MIETFINAIKDDDANEYIVMVTGDHTTPTQVGDHTYEPVPIMMSLLSNYHGANQNDLGLLMDEVETYDEVAFQDGSPLLGRYPSKYTLPTVFALR